MITLISMEDAKPMTSNRRHYTPSRLAKLSGLVLLVTPFFYPILNDRRFVEPGQIPRPLTRKKHNTKMRVY